MKDIPILFQGAMVRALLDGTKTQTRRMIKVQPDNEATVTVEHYHPTVIDRHGDEQPGAEIFGAWWADGECGLRCPYGQPGDRLWVREAWAYTDGIGLSGGVLYRADFGEGTRTIKYRPSIHMPRALSRIDLEVTGVRVERLQDISPSDCEAEGVQRLPLQEDVPSPWYTADVSAGPVLHSRSAIGAYHKLWEHLNGPGSWAANPYVWVLTFKRISA